MSLWYGGAPFHAANNMMEQNKVRDARGDVENSENTQGYVVEAVIYGERLTLAFPMAGDKKQQIDALATILGVMTEEVDDVWTAKKVAESFGSSTAASEADALDVASLESQTYRKCDHGFACAQSRWCELKNCHYCHVSKCCRGRRGGLKCKRAFERRQLRRDIASVYSIIDNPSEPPLFNVDNVNMPDENMLEENTWRFAHDDFVDERDASVFSDLPRDYNMLSENMLDQNTWRFAHNDFVG